MTQPNEPQPGDPQEIVMECATCLKKLTFGANGWVHDRRPAEQHEADPRRRAGTAPKK